MTYQLEIINNSSFPATYDVVDNCIFDVTFSKKRDEKNPALTFTQIDGTIQIFGDDFVTYSHLANKQTQGRIIEVGDTTEIYDIYLTFNDILNPATKFISAKISINSIYQNVINSYEKDFNIDSLDFIPKRIEKGSSIISDNNIWLYVYELAEVIKSVFTNIDDSVTFGDFSLIDNFLFIGEDTKNDFEEVEYLQTKQQCDPTFTAGNLERLKEISHNTDFMKISLKSILDMLTDLFSIFWYLDENVLNFTKNYISLTAQIDITDFSHIKNSVTRLTKKPKFTKIENTQDDYNLNLNLNYEWQSKINDVITMPFGTSIWKIFNNDFEKSLLKGTSTQIILNDFYHRGSEFFNNFFTGGSDCSASDPADIKNLRNDYVQFNIRPLENGDNKFYSTRNFYAYKNEVITINFDSKIQHTFFRILKKQNPLEIAEDFGYYADAGTETNRTFSFTAPESGWFCLNWNILFYDDNDYIDNIEIVAENQYSIDDFNEDFQIRNILTNDKNLADFDEAQDDTGNVYTFTEKNNQFRDLICIFNENFNNISFNSVFKINTENYRAEIIERKINKSTKFNDLITISKSY